MFKTMLSPQYFVVKAFKSKTIDEYTNSMIGLMNYWVRWNDYGSRKFREWITDQRK